MVELEGPNGPIEYLETSVIPFDRFAEDDCVLCCQVIAWFEESQPEGTTDLPELEPRKAAPVLRFGQDADPMPLCPPCAQVFLALIGQLRKEELERKGVGGTGMTARVEPPRIATPARPGIVLPGQPGFKAPQQGRGFADPTPGRRQP